MKKYYIGFYTYEFGKAKSVSIAKLPTKFQFGDLAHAKRAVAKHVGKKLKWKKDDRDYAQIWYAYDSAGKWRGEVSEKRIKKNPDKRSRMIGGVEHFTLFTGKGWAVFKMTPDGISGSQIYFAGTGQAGYDAAIKHLAEMKGNKNPSLPNPAKRFTAKQLAELKKRFADIGKIDPASPTYKTLIAAIDLYPQTMLKQLANADIKFLSVLARNRIKRKGNPKMAKKKRSAKQLANDRRLGRMAKARAKKKRGKNPRRKVSRRKVSKAIRQREVQRLKLTARQRRARPALKKSHLWRVFRCRGKSVMWLKMDASGKYNWTSKKGDSILFGLKGAARRVAQGIASKPGYASYDVGAVDRDTTAAQIATFCRGKV